MRSACRSNKTIAFTPEGRAVRLKIAHLTRYDFAEPAQYGLQQIRLTPKTRRGQSIEDWSVTFEGARQQVQFVDEFNNQTLLIGLEEGAEFLSIRAEGTVLTDDQSGIVGQHGGWTPLWIYRRKTPLTAPGEAIRQISQRVGSAFNDEVSRLHALMMTVAELVRYETGTTGVATTAEEAAAAGSGVCQDHTHIFISCARLLGFPARYVSGYLMMDDRVQQDASHAWAEAYAEGLGWVGFDVSNAISPDTRYVAVATGLDYTDAAPVSGLSFGNAQQGLEVSVQVQQQQQQQ